VQRRNEEEERYENQLSNLSFYLYSFIVKGTAYGIMTSLQNLAFAVVPIGVAVI